MGDAIAAYYARAFVCVAIVLVAAGVLISKGCDFAVSRANKSAYEPRRIFENEAVNAGAGKWEFGRRPEDDVFHFLDAEKEYKRGFEAGRKSVFSEMRESGNLEPVPRIPAE